MKKNLSILIIEDSPVDAELNARLLQNAGYDIFYQRVDTATDMIKHMEQTAWDMILCDYSMPQFSVEEALEIYHLHGADIPFIVISGMIGEEKAVQLIKEGAHNCILKGNMARFIPIIKRELREAHNRRELVKLNASLAISEDKYRSYIDHAPDCVFVTDENGMYVEVNEAKCRITGFTTEELLKMSIFDILPEETRKEVKTLFGNLVETGVLHADLTFSHKSGTMHWWDLEAIQLSNGGFLIFAKNITRRKQAEKLLQQTRQNFESFFNTIDDFLFVLDENGTINHANSTVFNRLGYTEAELTGKSVLMVHPPDRREEAGRIVYEMLNGQTSSCMVPLITKSGELIEVETKVTHGSWDGKPAIFGVTKDISKLRLSEEKFSKLFHINPSACGLSSLDDGTYIEVNEAFYKLLGFSKDEVIGKSASELGILSAETRSAVLTFADQNWDISNVEADLTAKNGDIKHVLLSSQNIHMQQERYRYTVVHDITKRKQAEQKLKESEERYRVLTQSANDAIITINSQGKIVDWNRGAEKIFGYAESEITGKNLTAIVPKQFSATHQENINRVLNGGPAHVLGKTLELSGLHRNGHEFPVEISLASWENASGTFFTGIIRDITRRREIEKSLIDSEANLALAQQIAHIGSWDWNMTTNKVQWSKEMFHVFDMDPEANYGAPESIIRLLHPDDVESFRESLRENIATGGSPALEYRVIHKDGSVHTIFAEGRIEFDATGKPLRNVGTVQDITERKRAEEEMRRAYSFLDSIIENIPDMIVIKDAKTLQFISFNRAGEHLLGISKEELAGKYDHDIFPAEYADIYNETDREVIQSRKMMDIPEEQIETRTNGLRILHTYKVPILDAQGEPEYLLCISEDITELKLAEQARKISEEKYKTMLDASPDGILLTDLKGIITEASEIGLELFGADKREDLVGKNFFRFIPSAEKKNIREIIEKTMNEGLAQNTELTIKKKNQAVFVSETSTTLLQDANGEPLSFMIIVRDISQRKKTETKQMHADRMANLGEMASGIAHEINQPLNIISMVMDKILIETTRTANVDKGFLAVKSEKIFENITRIRNIIDHVRAFSRTNDDYVLTAFDLNLSIRNAVSMIAEQFKHLGITLNLMLDNEIPPITGNTYKFEQVIINLLVNAKDAVIDRRTQQQDSSELIIGIRSFQDNQLLIVEITDNGIGIGKDDINNIWLPFYTTKDEGKGTGLGLSICYQIIKSMGGTIDIASTKLKGTTIKIALNRQK